MGWEDGDGGMGGGTGMRGQGRRDGAGGMGWEDGDGGMGGGMGWEDGEDGDGGMGRHDGMGDGGRGRKGWKRAKSVKYMNIGNSSLSFRLRTFVKWKNNILQSI